MASEATARDDKPSSRLRLIGEAVIFRHTLFSLPFALLAILLETDGRPPLRPLLLAILAAAAARNAANALNRVIDARIDARNPRTAGRHLPAGTLSSRSLLVFSALMGVIVVVAAALLNPLCVALLPVAAVLIGGYSYTKRFTWLCHYWLGVACAAAPMGAFLALSGRFEFRYFVLAGAVALWVAGFDILYALQDIDFDRKESLHSIPARFGSRVARMLSALSHLGTAAGLAALPLFWELSWIYLGGIAIATALLTAEHVVVRGGTQRHVRIASYSINEIIPLVVLAFGAADIYLG
ncbi:MAG: UbiA-like polyprenyltransferase [Spirochaetia bacterium]|jgi:4-hydroxybenzoate polyprenyltransferase|nr:UbiA-like polyprenyltransferase [Spirochaetia bacterium]